MTPNETPEQKRNRIAAARAALAAAYAAIPEAVARFHAKKAKIEAIRKRERQRVEILVQGGDRPPPSAGKARVRGKKRTVKTPVPLEPDVDAALSIREAWSHKQHGTPETWQHFQEGRPGAIARLYSSGAIDSQQLAAAEEISLVAERIGSEVSTSIASLEARVDASRRGDHLEERLGQVRQEIAYGLWREALPTPAGAVVDMIVADIGLAAAAAQHHVHKRRLRKMLIGALDGWPDCLDRARASVSQRDLDAMYATLA